MTLSAADKEWDDVMGLLLELELKRPVSQQEIHSLGDQERFHSLH